MIGAEWLACTNSQPMLEFLRSEASDRKVRRWASLEQEEFRDAVQKAEAFADGLADRTEMLQAYEKARATTARVPR